MNLNRREFIKNSTLVSSAFIIGFNLPIKGMAAKVEEKKEEIIQPNAFIKINKPLVALFIFKISKY